MCPRDIPFLIIGSIGCTVLVAETTAMIVVGDHGALWYAPMTVLAIALFVRELWK